MKNILAALVAVVVGALLVPVPAFAQTTPAAAPTAPVFIPPAPIVAPAAPAVTDPLWMKGLATDNQLMIPIRGLSIADKTNFFSPKGGKISKKHTGTLGSSQADIWYIGVGVVAAPIDESVSDATFGNLGRYTITTVEGRGGALRIELFARPGTTLLIEENGAYLSGDVLVFRFAIPTAKDEAGVLNDQYTRKAAVLAQAVADVVATSGDNQAILAVLRDAVARIEKATADAAAPKAMATEPTK